MSHTGYLLQAATALAKGNPGWLAAWRPQLIDIARDFAAPPGGSDAWFPSARHFDWFEGHSWAAGLEPVNSGRSQVGGQCMKHVGNTESCGHVQWQEPGRQCIMKASVK